jgi:Tfp pilus assembly protein PilV
MKLTHEKCRRQAGITIIEVVIASALLLVAVVPILKAMTSAQVTSRIVERKTMSLTLAQGKMSEIQARMIHNFSASYDETATVLSGQYLVNVSDDGHASRKTISVSVGFDDDDNNALTSAEVLITLTTLVAMHY